LHLKRYLPLLKIEDSAKTDKNVAILKCPLFLI